MKGSGFPLSSPEKRGGVKSVPPPHPYSPSRYSPAPTLPPLHSPTHSPNPPTTNEAPPPPRSPSPHHSCVSGTWTCGASWGSAKRAEELGGSPTAPAWPRGGQRGGGHYEHPQSCPQNPSGPLTLSDFLFFAAGRKKDLYFFWQNSAQNATPHPALPGQCLSPPHPQHTGMGHEGHHNMCPHPVPSHLSSRSRRTNRCR